jgi:signal transduction histidine kinase/ActR/RegA family two-component response regulator
VEDRILVLAPRGRDAEVVAQVLTRQGRVCSICPDIAALAREIGRGAGAVLITEEALAQADRDALVRRIGAQPPWSDLPFILLSTKRTGRRPPAAVRILEELGNVLVLERPIHGETLARAAASALRARRKQYETRRHLEQLREAEERLTQLNATLESRIHQRTRELSEANNRLMAEIAERERAQQAFVQAQKMEAVGQLTGGIAHDFNNLLTVIVGNLELVERRLADAPTARLVGFAREAADRAAKLTHQLLAFSRTQKLALRPVDVNTLVVGTDDLLRRTLGSQIDIRIKLAPEGPWAMADPHQLELALLNLAINARDAMGERGALAIESAERMAPDAVEGPGPYVVISVTDTGPGIPPHLIEKVFDPFFTTKPVGKGTGLGLSQVYGIARQSGGFVRIDSPPGQGATIEIWLPRTEAQAQPEAPAAAVPRARQAGQARILVADDDTGVRTFICDCLEAVGYAVIQAADGAEALQLLDEQAPDLLIVDFAMPGLNGVDVVKEAWRRAPDLPILLATGYADMKAVDAVMDRDRILRKPFKVDDLEAAVALALGHGAGAGSARRVPE